MQSHGWHRLFGLVSLLAVLSAGQYREPRHGSTQEAIDEANEVIRLQEKIHQHELMIARWRRKHSAARRYHKGQKKLMEKQIEIRESQASTHSVDIIEYEARKEESYKYRMCAKVMNAFYFSDDQKDKVDVIEHCMGRKSMHLLQHATPLLSQPQSLPAHKTKVLLRHRTTPLLEHDAVETQLRRQFTEMEASFANLLSRGRSLVRRCAESGACQHPEVRGPVEQMNVRLDELEMELRIVRAEYFADAARWRRERQALRKQEQGMGDNHVDTYHQKQAAKRRAWIKVKNKFCPVVYKNYRYNEDAIVDYAMTECDE